MMDRPNIRAAVRNNAEWCDVMCRAHGIVGRFSREMWTSEHRTPPFYPDAVTLEKSATVERVLDCIDTETPGCSIKDSFANLDFSGSGFRILFDAEWIYCPADAPRAKNQSDLMWWPVRDEQALSSWEIAWSEDGTPQGLFLPALLQDDSVMVLGSYVGNEIVAGAVLNRSQSVVGVSNLFSKAGDLSAAWSGVVAAAREIVPGAALVGYESGEDLAAAREQGFVTIGPLRVWQHKD